MKPDKHSATEALTIAIIWDGAMSVLLPVEHCRVWRGGPRWWRSTIDWFVARPELTRTLGVAELGVGMWLATRAIKSSAEYDLVS
jgi:hypothetical protein